MITYKDLGAEVGALVDEKNTAYGNSFNVAEDFIKLLWPKGVPPESFNDMLCVVRIFDKLKRIAANKGYGGESPYRDIAGYALLGLMKDQRKPLDAYTDAELDKLYAPTETPSWTPAEVVEDMGAKLTYGGIIPIKPELSYTSAADEGWLKEKIKKEMVSKPKKKKNNKNKP